MEPVPVRYQVRYQVPYRYRRTVAKINSKKKREGEVNQEELKKNRQLEVWSDEDNRCRFAVELESLFFYI